MPFSNRISIDYTQEPLATIDSGAHESSRECEVMENSKIHRDSIAGGGDQSKKNYQQSMPDRATQPTDFNHSLSTFKQGSVRRNPQGYIPNSFLTL